MDCRGRCHSYRIGLRPSTRNECVCLLCLGIGQQEFQAAHLIATKAKTCQVVAFNPQLRSLDHCRQTRCLFEGCGQECQRNSRNVLQAQFKASIQAHQNLRCGDPSPFTGREETTAAAAALLLSTPKGALFSRKGENCCSITSRTVSAVVIKPFAMAYPA